MKTVSSLPFCLRWLSDHPLKTGLGVSAILLVTALEFGDRTPWLLAIPIVISAVVTLSAELLPRSETTLHPVAITEITKDAKQLREVSSGKFVQNGADGKTKAGDTVRFLVSYGASPALEWPDSAFPLESGVTVSRAYHFSGQNHARKLIAA